MVQVNILLTAKDSLDGYARVWGLWFDKLPGNYIGGGQYQTPPDISEVHLSGDVMSTGFDLQPGDHTVVIAITQSGGPANGSYSGSITLNSKSFPFSGVTASSYATISFNLAADGTVSTTAAGVPLWVWAVGGIAAASLVVVAVARRHG